MATVGVSAASAAPPRSAPWTVTVSPGSVVAGATNQTLSFSFTSTAGSSQTVHLVVPAAGANGRWTAPQATTAGAAGFVAVDRRTCSSASVGSISGIGPWTIRLDVRCARGRAFTVRYGAGGTVTAPTLAGTYLFTSQGQVGGGFINLQDQAVTVSPGPASQLRLSGLGNAVAGDRLSPTVTALDRFGNVATGFRGTVSFTESGPARRFPRFPTPGQLIPADYTFTATDGGTRTFTNGLILNAAGQRTITVNTAPGITASSTITIAPADAIIVETEGVFDAAMVEGATEPKQEIRLFAADTYGNFVGTHAGTVGLTWSVPDTSDPTIFRLEAPGNLPASASFTDGKATFVATYPIITDVRNVRTFAGATFFASDDTGTFKGTRSVGARVNFVPTSPDVSVQQIPVGNDALADVLVLKDVVLVDTTVTVVLKPDLVVESVQPTGTGGFDMTLTGSTFTVDGVPTDIDLVMTVGVTNGISPTGTLVSSPTVAPGDTITVAGTLTATSPQVEVVPQQTSGTQQDSYGTVYTVKSTAKR